MWNWKREFTVREFTSVFPSPSPNKVLHDMAKKGLLENVGWGRYKVNSPEEYLAKRINISEAYDLLKQAEMKYALSGPDAVFFWTKGGYQVDRFFGFYPIHLKVRKEDLRKWMAFFRSRKQRVYVKDQRVSKTLFGLFYVLYPEADFETEEVGEFKVEPLKDTVEFCKRHIYSYEPALEMLDEMYNLRLRVKYKEVETNF
ncbi:hypothetical protein KEJ51_06780 [Candidatus Bathyarchaeota archaeon]|nr:hypothetical protein [Candidatus Bathyarchaeota archaeon]MBS7629017.1 hypothetical protein [Candidatus Bathyarchaeota archaeon]